MFCFQIFHGGNSTFTNSFDKTKFLLLSEGEQNIVIFQGLADQLFAEAEGTA